MQGERRYRWAQWWQLPCVQVIPHGVPVSTDSFKMRVQMAALLMVYRVLLMLSGLVRLGSFIMPLIMSLIPRRFFIKIYNINIQGPLYNEG